MRVLENITKENIFYKVEKMIDPSSEVITDG
jgi:hypothetical protein